MVNLRECIQPQTTLTHLLRKHNNKRNIHETTPALTLHHSESFSSFLFHKKFFIQQINGIALHMKIIKAWNSKV